MGNSRRFTRLLQAWKKIAVVGGAGTAAAVLAIALGTAYYYFTTPPNTVIITAADIPAGLTANFAPNNLTDHVMAHLQEMIAVADSAEVKDLARQEGLGPRLVKQTFIPIRAFSSSPSPIFNLKWRGVDLNLCRSIGMSLRASAFLELGVIGMPQGGWRLTALLKDGSGSELKFSGSAPSAEGACPDFERCADDLTEQILHSLDERRLLSFYIKKNTEAANRHILEMYEKTIPAETLKADDLITWGNAYYGLREFDRALQKYQEALEKDGNSCPAYVARGFVYYSRPHAQKLDDLYRAEQDFRKGIACDQKNKFTRTALCHTLLQEWANSPPGSPGRGDGVLVEAKEQCDKALEIDPQFVTAAVNVGYILYQQGKYQDALRYFDNLGQRYPTSAALFLNYGFLLYRQYLRDNSEDTLGQAAAQTLKAWNLEPGNDTAANNLGYFYYEQGNYGAAVEFWKKANAISPDDPDVIAGLALGTYKLGDEGAAAALLSRAIQIDRHYGDPAYLVQHNALSKTAAADLTQLIKLLPK